MSNPWEVLKFGGSSVAEAKHWPTILTLCQQKLIQGKKLIIVLSALKDVSNLLEALLQQSLTGAHHDAIQELKELHYRFATELNIDGETLLHSRFEELSNYCEQILIEQKITPECYAKVLACGELLSTTLGVHFLQLHIKDCQWLDARELLISKAETEQHPVDDWHHYLSAECEFDYNPKVSQQLAKTANLIVTQGFIAADNNQKTVLLGREGSDTSAAYLAAIVGAKKLEIWTDVAGIFTTNPRELPNARRLKCLNYADARRMANFGAKVLHPRAIKPAEKNNIWIKVKDVSKPQLPGTLINNQTSIDNNSIFAVVARQNVTQIQFVVENREVIRIFESLGYDTLIEFHSDIDQTNSNNQLMLSFVDTTTAEPSIEELKALLHKFGVKQKLTIKQGFGMLTVVGVPFNKAFNEIQNFIQNHLEINQHSIYHFEQSGRLSVVIPNHQTHKSLMLLHKTFIEGVSCNQLFGRSWEQLEFENK